MEILGVGPSELIFIIIIALIVLGPKDMQKAGRTIGQYLNKLVRSDGWKAFQQTSRELRNLPTNLMREANLDLAETEKEIRKSMKMPLNPNPGLSQPQQTENSILPPSATKANPAEPAIAIETPDTPDDKVSPPNQNA
jgi:sec-independent protein translocase protein TatB